MAGRAVPTTIGPSDVRRYRFRLLRGQRRPSAPAATDRLAPARSATRSAARQRPRPDAEICDGEVSWPSPQSIRQPSTVTGLLDPRSIEGVEPRALIVDFSLRQ